MKTLVRYRRVLIVLLHLALIILANFLAFWLRFDGAIPAEELARFREMLPWLIAIRSLVFIRFQLYGGLWRYTGLWDLRNIVVGVGSSTVLFYIVVRWVLGVIGYPRSIFVTDFMLLIFLMGGVRLAHRLRRERPRVKSEKRVLIFGAGDAAEMVVRDMKKNAAYDYEPIGFVDDDVSKIGHRIHGVEVLGTRKDLPAIIATTTPQEVLVAIPRADPATIRGVVKALQPFKVPIMTLPNLGDILNGTVTVSHIRSLSIEDLLPRAPVGLDAESVRHLIAGRRILVTGAGGSIGSELSRQISALEPGVLVLFERYENGLYNIANDISDRNSTSTVRAVIGDITDLNRLNSVMAEYRPQIVFHAAAHKHVPLMELNICEAIKNNVIGTRILAEAAARHGVERFVLISSDKAVNPSSVMGATKRVAELILQRKSSGHDTRFVTVRFGNVLGSNGSVVPRFLAQINAGGPVTVTHPDIRRYFMMIPEAVQLVLQAAASAEEAELFVLDMGEQIRVLDLARNLIRLSGFVPEEEIPIAFIGLRPGEKLFEELAGADEVLERSSMEKIFRVRTQLVPDDIRLARQIADLEGLAKDGDSTGVLRQLCLIVPTFRPGAEEPFHTDVPMVPALAAASSSVRSTALSTT
jgi:FlaA1/EpsC-like NDP-sugar epimerase